MCCAAGWRAGADYERIEDEIDIALALNKPEGFEQNKVKDAAAVYTARVSFAKGREPSEKGCDRQRHPAQDALQAMHDFLA